MTEKQIVEPSVMSKMNHQIEPVALKKFEEESAVFGFAVEVGLDVSQQADCSSLAIDAQQTFGQLENKKKSKI